MVKVHSSGPTQRYHLYVVTKARLVYSPFNVPFKKLFCIFENKQYLREEIQRGDGEVYRYANCSLGVVAAGPIYLFSVVTGSWPNTSFFCSRGQVAQYIFLVLSRAGGPIYIFGVVLERGPKKSL